MFIHVALEGCGLLGQVLGVGVSTVVPESDGPELTGYWEVLEVVVISWVMWHRGNCLFQFRGV